MTEHRHFEKIATWSGLLTTLFMIGNTVTLLISVGRHSEALFDAAALLQLGASAAAMFHVSMVFDLLAYLSLAPVVVFCWSRLKETDEGLVTLVSLCGVAYSLLGSIGAAVVDAVLPQMMEGYASTAGAQQQVMQVIARSLYRAVEHGIWNPLEVLMVSIWLVGLGWLLRRRKPGLGMLALAAGIIGLLDPIGWMVQSDTVLSIGALSNVLIPVWTAWFAIDLLQHASFP